MIAGYHLIWTAHGWWLANDPRGSNSAEISVERLESLGKLHPGRKRVQPGGKIISEFYEAAKDLLAHSLLTFDSDRIALIAKSIATVTKENPEVVIHTAAFNDVDGAQKHPDQAYRGNALATRNVALACQRFDATLVHGATAYVFSGAGAPEAGYR